METLTLVNVDVNRYFSLGEPTRRNSVIGCIGFEEALPSRYYSEEEEEEEKEKECPICFEVLGKTNFATTTCGHTFCLSCLLSNLKINSTCPLCRADIEQKKKITTNQISSDDAFEILDYQIHEMGVNQTIENIIAETTNNPEGEGLLPQLLEFITEFGINLLYEAACYVSGEEDVWPEFQSEGDSDDEDSDSDDDDSDSDSDDSDSDESCDSDAETVVMDMDSWIKTPPYK